MIPPFNSPLTKGGLRGVVSCILHPVSLFLFLSTPAYAEVILYDEVEGAEEVKDWEEIGKKLGL